MTTDADVCVVRAMSTYKLIDKRPYTLRKSDDSRTTSTKRFVDAQQAYSVDIVDPIAFRLCGFREGVSSDTTLVMNFLTCVYAAKKVEHFELGRIVFSTVESVVMLQRILEKHASTLRFVALTEMSSPTIPFDKVVDAFCSLRLLSFAYWNGLETKTCAMRSELVCLRDERRCDTLLRQLTRTLYNRPQFNRLIFDVGFTAQAGNALDAICAIDAMERCKALAAFFNSKEYNRLLCNFAIAFVRLPLHHFDMVKIFAFVVLDKFRANSTSKFYDESLFVDTIFADGGRFVKQYLCKLSNFKLVQTEYFCRNCHFPLCRVDQPLACACPAQRASFCSQVCRKKRLSTLRSCGIRPERLWKPVCCTQQREFDFSYCSECLLPEYNVPNSAICIQVGCACPKKPYCTSVFCTKCYFGACPRGCKKTFSNEQWATFAHKTHRVVSLCLMPNCPSLVEYDCSSHSGGASTSSQTCPFHS